MDFSTLQSLFGIRNNKTSSKTLSLKSTDFPDSAKAFFTNGFDNRALSLSQPELKENRPESGRIVVRGVASFLNVPNVDTCIQCWIDGSGNVQLIATYTLLGANPGPNDWCFSKSFPDLPRIPDNTKYLLFDRQTGESWQPTTITLDDFAFFNASFIVSSTAVTDPISQRPLQPGINFAAMIRPEGPIAITANAFQVTTELPVTGQIRLPVQGETPATLRTRFSENGSNFLFPWSVQDQFDDGVPGILLKVDIGIETSLGNKAVEIDGDGLLIYTPVNDDWMLTDTNPAFRPVQALTGSVNLPSANINTRISMPFEPGIDQWTGIAECEGLSLGNLSHMAGISGSKDGFLGHLPKELQKSAKVLGKLELSGFSVLVDYNDPKAISVNDITVVIGMPELNWEIWPDRFTLTNIAATFSVRHPFSTSASSTDSRSIETKLTAQMLLGDTPCRVTASSWDGFALYAQMDAGYSIPLGRLLKQHAPDIPVPANMTISTLRLGVEPGQSYSMAMAFDGEDGSFPIPIGPATLKVDDVSMYIAYNKNQGFSGSVSGKVLYRNNVLRVSYDTPGDVLIYSFIPETSLNDVLETFTAGELTLPNSFDLKLTNNTVQIQRSGNDSTFILATEVEKLGTLAVQIGKQSGSWGAAFGLALNEPRLSALPGLKALKVIDDTLTLSQLTLLVSSFDSPSFSFPELSAFSNPALSSSSIPMPAGGGVVKGFNVMHCGNWIPGARI